MSSWMCDGIVKNGQQYPNASGEHEAYENFGPDCVMCGLPKEAMQGSGKPAKTKMVSSQGNSSSFPLPIIIGAIALCFVLVGGAGLFFLLNKPSEDTSSNNNDSNISPTTPINNSGDFISDNASHSAQISQGEKILLNSTVEKEAGAASFSQQDWMGAIAEYEKASQINANDPENKIYSQNAQAREAGNPLMIAAVVPIGNSADSAAEILRGVASYQEEFNQSPVNGRLLEVVIADSSDSLIASSLANDLINSGTILGVLGYGVDPGSQKAIKKYNDEGLAVLSPLTTSLEKSILKTIPVAQKSGQLLNNYLQAVSKTLTQFANKKHSKVKAVIYFNSDSPYSLQLKQELNNYLSDIVEEIDITNSSDFADKLANASQNGANTVFLALSKNKVPEAVEIAQVNQNLTSPLTIMGGDELYNADILVQGGDAIANLILAVPWSFNPKDPFAKDAVQSWKGRVSWRTATAYDATKALGEAIRQDPTKSGTADLLNQGITMTGSTTDFNIFNEVPLVKAIKGKSGPPGSDYQFDSIL